MENSNQISNRKFLIERFFPLCIIMIISIFIYDEQLFKAWWYKADLSWKDYVKLSMAVIGTPIIILALVSVVRNTWSNIWKP